MVIQPRGQGAAIPDVFCGQDALKVTPTAKYLGVVIDCELSWKQHVENVTKRTAQTIGQLWRHGRALSLSARRSWFISMISSHLCYASTAFYPCLTVQLCLLPPHHPLFSVNLILLLLRYISKNYYFLFTDVLVLK